MFSKLFSHTSLFLLALILPSQVMSKMYPVTHFLDDNDLHRKSSPSSDQQQQEQQQPVEYFYQPWTAGGETRLSYSNDQVKKFTLVDVGCPCEQFEVFLNGISQGLTSPPGVDAQGCKNYNGDEHLDGDIALKNLNYSALQFVLFNDRSNFIQVFNRRHCSERGSLAFKFEDDDGVCSRGTDYTVVRDPKGSQSEASRKCSNLDQQYGLAPLTSNNFDEATQVAWTCLGEAGRTWIESWNGNDYNHNPGSSTCIAMTVASGFGNSGGTINVPPEGCDGNLATLCSK